MDVPGDDDVVHGAARLERRVGEVRHLHGVVDQLVVVVRAIAAEAPERGAGRAQRRRHAPPATGLAGRRGDLHLTGRIGAAVGAQEYERAVEVAARGVEVRAADREVERVHLRDDGERTGARRRAPKVLRFLLDGDGFARRFGAHRDEMPGELADQVTAGNPRRESEALAVRRRRVERAAHLEQVRAAIERYDPIAGHWQ